MTKPGKGNEMVTDGSNLSTGSVTEPTIGPGARTQCQMVRYWTLLDQTIWYRTPSFGVAAAYCMWCPA